MASKNNQVFFIIGCPRSATTAVAHILDTASNARVFVEQGSKKDMCIASREAFKKKLEKPEECIKNIKNDHIVETLKEGYIYGDKNPNYLNFVFELKKLWQAKFIFVIRDGREVVRSILNSYKHRRGSYFGLAEDGVENGSNEDSDWWDYSRLRPNIDQEYSDVWPNLSRFEKCCWYWNQFNTEILRYFKKIGSEKCYILNINQTNPKEFETIFDFLNLRGFEYTEIQKMLSKKINSQIDFAGVDYEYPTWDEWIDKKKEIFLKHCKTNMIKLGFM